MHKLVLPHVSPTEPQGFGNPHLNYVDIYSNFAL